jgi:hypothetical protein
MSLDVNEMALDELVVDEMAVDDLTPHRNFFPEKIFRILQNFDLFHFENEQNL